MQSRRTSGLATFGKWDWLKNLKHLTEGGKVGLANAFAVFVTEWRDNEREVTLSNEK